MYAIVLSYARQLDVTAVQSLSSWISVFGILTLCGHHLNAAVSTFCDWFWQITMRPLGWQVGFSMSPAIVQIISAHSSRAFIKRAWFISYFVEWDSPSYV